LSRVKPKKHLGQHFLKDENIALKIVHALSLKDNTLLEVGPGTGVLTDKLIEREKFFALDVDTESIDYLKQRHPKFADKIIYQDFLQKDLSDYNDKLSVIGNFPYNISSQLFFQIYDHRQLVEEVVCMIQKEVADRIVSPPGNKVYGILSVLLGAYFEMEYLFTVKPGVFDPPPKVNSAVIRLQRNKVEQLDCDEVLFKKVVKAGFGQRRKTLRNALKALPLPTQLQQDEILNKRAEQLSVQEFINLTRKIGEYG
jgi:16S rRNA (adenine1518-N6/adenine1519-N6)-dimethyltransferase